MIRFSNGNIITMRSPGDRVRELCLRDDSFVDSVASGSATTIDLGGRTVIPGFCDAHTHFYYWAASLHHLDMGKAESLEEALRIVAQGVAGSAKDTWILGRGLDKNRWQPAEFPTAAQLDTAAPDHPVGIFSKDEHALWVNSRALQLAGITRDTQDPAGGKIGRHADGRPNGMLFEKAYFLVIDVLPPWDLDAASATLDHGAALVHPLGVTAVHDMGELAAWDAYLGWQHPTLDVVKYLPVEAAEKAVADGLHSGAGTPALRVGGLKLFTDGALGSQTAYMWNPYENAADNVGVARMTPAELHDRVGYAAAHNLACAIHAIGDRANSMVIEAAQKFPAIALRHRIEHVQLLRAEDIEPLAKCGWIASVQPSHLVSDRDMALKYWGPQRSRWAYAFGSMHKAGVPLAFGSDVPIEPIDPLFGIWAACARRHPEDARGPWEAGECIDRYTALHAFTAGAAYAAGLENEVGTLASGQRANFVVLDRDILKLPAQELLDVQILATFVGGRPVWVNQEAAPELAQTLSASAV